jgi:hypothetical protein
LSAAPRSVVTARVVLGCSAIAWLPIAVITAFVVGSLAHLDFSSGWGTAWGLHGLYAVVGAAIGLVGSALSGATAVSMGPGRGWTRIAGLLLAAAMTVTGFVIPGLILAIALLQPETGEWLSGPGPA